MDANERVTELLVPDATYRFDKSGFVDTLAEDESPAPGRAQATWQSSAGAEYYDHVQPTLGSLFVPAYRDIATQLRLAPGDTVLDVGCGPGHVTRRLAETVTPDGLAIGADVSTPMLMRATTRPHPTMGLLRADAQELPLRDESVDAACATAVVMLVPEPERAIAEMARVVKPGGWLVIFATSRPAGTFAAFTRPVVDLVGQFAGARMFDQDDIPDMLEEAGCDRIRSHQESILTVVRARKADS